MLARNKKRIRKIVGLIFLIGLTWFFNNSGSVENLIYHAAVQDQSTFSIVAVDPITGDVGAAGASCVPISAATLAAFAPGQGAAAIQAAYTPKNQSQVLDLLLQGKSASQIIDHVSRDGYDEMVDDRQYGVVTLQDENIQAVGFTGADNTNWAGDKQDISFAVSAQGNTLESQAVIDDALSAFMATDLGSVELSDRLLRALEAASAAGGDRRCNQPDIRQTAQAAFIAVSKAGQPPFSTGIGKDPSPNNPALPWLYISVVEAKGGPNPLLDLRGQYNAWRSENLPACENCNLDSIPVPAGGDPSPFYKAILETINRVGLVFVLSLLCTIIILIIGITIIYFLRRRKERNKSESD
jgi:uncharacterized Ntn-hydrolase superfamily protein